MVKKTVESLVINKKHLCLQTRMNRLFQSHRKGVYQLHNGESSSFNLYLSQKFMKSQLHDGPLPFWFTLGLAGPGPSAILIVLICNLTVEEQGDPFLPASLIQED